MKVERWELWDSEKIPTVQNTTVPSNGDVAVAFLTWCANVRKRAPRTIDTYGMTLESYLEFLGAVDVRCADVSLMEAWVTRPRKRRGRGGTGAPATQRKDTAILRSFYQWMYEHDLTDRDLSKALHGPTVRNINPKPLLDEHWVRLWALNDEFDDSSVVALGLGFFCGLRRHEIMALRVGQVTPSRIVDFQRKGGGEDTLPWRDLFEIHQEKLPHLAAGSARLFEAIGDLRTRSDDSPLITWPQGVPDGMNKRMARWCRKAAIPMYTPHQLRHSCATNLLRAGMPLHLVSRVLNHTNPTTTMRYVRAGSDEIASWRKTMQ